MGKQSQLLLQPTEVELGLQVGVEFDKNHNKVIIQVHLKSGTQNLAIFHNFLAFLALKMYQKNKILHFILLFHNLHCVRKKT